MSIYASYSESFLPRSGEQFADINGSKDQLDPDTFENTEVGVKWDFADGLSFTTALFENEQRSPQVADNDASTLDVIESSVSGFELQLDGAMSDFWTVSAGITVLSGSQANGVPRELPETMISVWNQFQINDRFSFGVGVSSRA